MNLTNLIDAVVHFFEALKGANYLAKATQLFKSIADAPPLLVLAYVLIGLSLLLIPIFDATATTTSTVVAAAIPQKTFYWIKAGGFLIASIFNPLLLPLLALEVFELRAQYKTDRLSLLVKNYHSFFSAAILGSYLFALDWNESRGFLTILILQLFASIVADLVHRATKQDTSVKKWNVVSPECFLKSTLVAEDRWMIDVRIVIPPSVSEQLLDKFGEDVLRATGIELASKAKAFETGVMEIKENDWIRFSTSLIGIPPDVIFTVMLEPFDRS